MVCGLNVDVYANYVVCVRQSTHEDRKIVGREKMESVHVAVEKFIQK